MKLRYWFLSGLPLGLLINYLLVSYYKFSAQIALKLRPELITLSWWEAFWSNHFTHWLWIVNPTRAYTFTAIVLVLLCMFFTGVLGLLNE